MKFKIMPDIFEKYPEAIVGILVVRNLNNEGKNEEIIQIIRNEENRLRSELKLGDLAQNSNIANWRRAYKLFGEDKDRASHEALIRRILKGNEITHINKLVDIYNYISIKYRSPVGGEDLDKIKGDIILKFATGNEKFFMLGSTEESHPENGEVIYVDDKEVLCRKWNWRESDNTKFTEETKNAFLVMEALPPLAKEIIERTLEEFGELVRKYCDGNITTYILDKNNMEIEF
jgi:lysyl-tRNA synthetase class 2